MVLTTTILAEPSASVKQCGSCGMRVPSYGRGNAER